MNRKILILIALSLALLAVVQGWQLFSMYGGMRSEFVRKAEGAIDRAIKSQMSRSKNNIRVVTVVKDSIGQRGVTVNKGVNIDVSLVGYGKYETENEFKQLDSLLAANFESVGIDTLFSYYLANGQRVVDGRRSDIEGGIEVRRAITDDLQLVVTLENPTRDFFAKMALLVVTSLITIALVCYIFLYLVRTIFRQKSIEQMRRDFTHNITHELKTPLAVAFSANDLMITYRERMSEQDMELYLAKTRSSLTALSDMVERILATSVEDERGVKISREELNLREIFEDIAEKSKAKHSKRVQYTYNFSVGILRADRFHLSNALSNIVENAIKYSGESVVIVINVFEDAGKVVIEIVDNGIGIPRAARKHIFEKYYRVSTGNVQNVRGYGLGLYYVKNVVELHGGSIRVDSTQGEGSVFIIKLPI